MTLVLGLSFFVSKDHPLDLDMADRMADEFVHIIREEQVRNGGTTDVMVSAIPQPIFLRADDAPTEPSEERACTCGHQPLDHYDLLDCGWELCSCAEYKEGE